MYTSMKTISLDHPVRVYFKDGECYHESATIVIANGFPSFVRGRGPDVIYPWESVKHIIRVADEPKEATVRLERVRADLVCANTALSKDLASVTEQRDVLKRQLEELRADMRKPVLSQPKQVEPGGPIWVRVVDTSSKHFGLVGRLEGIEMDSEDGEMWAVDLGGIVDVRWRANVFAVVGTGRQGPGSNEAPKPDAEHQQAQNRDKWRATCLAYGAKDCTVYFGPGSEMTLVVELKDSYRLEDVRRGLYNEHGLRPDQFTLREVRPIVDGVKVVSMQSASKSEPHYGEKPGAYWRDR